MHMLNKNEPLKVISLHVACALNPIIICLGTSWARQERKLASQKYIDLEGLTSFADCTNTANDAIRMIQVKFPNYCFVSGFGYQITFEAKNSYRNCRSNQEILSLSKKSFAHLPLYAIYTNGRYIDVFARSWTASFKVQNERLTDTSTFCCPFRHRDGTHSRSI